MRLINLLSLIILFQLCFGCSTPKTSDRYNILLICVDDLRPELQCYGTSYIHSPNIDQLAENGVLFENHYVNAPSCGPSRYTMLTGQYGSYSNQALFKRADLIKQGKAITPSMPEWFKQQGYITVSVGKVSHHPGGRGGHDWNDENTLEMPRGWDRHIMPVGEWQHPRGMMHGLAHGEIREIPSDMDVIQSEEGDDSIYPDGLITQETLNQLRLLASDNQKPFFLATGILKPHLPFGAPKSYLDLYENTVLPLMEHSKKPDWKSTWHPSGEFRNYNTFGKDPNIDSLFAENIKRHYAACVSYADSQVGKILKTLRDVGADKNTIVVLWGDHGLNLGEHGIWGKHNLFEEALRSPLIISSPGIKKTNIKTKAVVETLDIFPTLCELTGIDFPNFVHGKSIVSNLENPMLSGYTALSYMDKAVSLRTQTYRLTVHETGEIELYDHTSPEKEGKNIADDNPKIIEQLKKELNTKLANRPL